MQESRCAQGSGRANPVSSRVSDRSNRVVQVRRLRSESVWSVVSAHCLTLEDIAAMVHFLLSPDANLVTGQALNVDGGIEVH